MQRVFQFPTFPMRDPAITTSAVPGLAALVAQGTAAVAAQTDVPADTFAHPDRLALVDDAAATRRAHLACFIEDLAVAQWYEARRGAPTVVTSYSMGLYPALVFVGALRLADALRIMQCACDAAHASAGPGPFAMLAITGPDGAAVAELITLEAPLVECTDRYALDTHLLTGRLSEVQAIQRAATARGWTDTLLLPVSAPFHSTALRAAQAALDHALTDVPITDPRVPVRSSTAPVWLRSAADVREEIRRNVWSPMDWAGTILAIASDGASEFLECGTSRRLSNVAARLVGAGHQIRSLADDALSPAT